MKWEGRRRWEVVVVRFGWGVDGVDVVEGILDNDVVTDVEDVVDGLVAMICLDSNPDCIPLIPNPPCLIPIPVVPPNPLVIAILIDCCIESNGSKSWVRRAV